MFEESGDFHFIPFVSDAKGTYALEFLTGSYTALAPDTSAVILDDSRVEHIDGVLFIRDQVQEQVVAGKHLGSQSLELAVSVLVAFGAVGIMLGKKQLDDVLTGHSDLHAIGMDYHSFSNRGGTCSREVSDFFLFHDADTAVPCYAKIFMVAEGRDMDIEYAGRFQNGRTFIYGDLYSVNGKSDCFGHDIISLDG